jgi:hypothetical protein
MSTSPISSQVDLTSRHETSLLSTLSTAPSLSLSDGHMHSDPKGHYTQLSMNDKDQAFSHSSLRPICLSLMPWFYEILSFGLAQP